MAEDSQARTLRREGEGAMNPPPQPSPAGGGEQIKADAYIGGTSALEHKLKLVLQNGEFFSANLCSSLSIG